MALSLYACTDASNANSANTKNLTSVAPDSIQLSDIPIYTKYADMEYLFKQQNDTTYVINFWATWCKPCVAELPYIEALHEAYAGEKIKVILVSLDFPKQLETKLVPFINKQQLKSDVHVLVDGSTGWIDKVSTQWDGAIPVTMIYKGYNREFINGGVDSFEELNNHVKKVFEL